MRIVGQLNLRKSMNRAAVLWAINRQPGKVCLDSLTCVSKEGPVMRLSGPCLGDRTETVGVVVEMDVARQCVDYSIDAAQSVIIDCDEVAVAVLDLRTFVV